MFIDNFHFLRPYWFLALIPIAFILWKLAKQHLINKHWESVCDSKLLPYILVGKSETKKKTHLVLTGIVSLLIIIALAGPTWQRLPQPVFEKKSALVIALDLSLSMYADDVKPSRLERARFKISDILNLRKEGQTALLVYADDAFTVTPLTDDVKTINSQLSALSPAIMPAPGSRTDRAIKKATALLKQAGISQGHILLVTDEVDIKYKSDFEEAKKEGYKISILGLGTKEGVPVSLGKNGFLKDRQGAIVMPILNDTILRQLADLGGGYYETSQITDGDIERLNRLFNSKLESGDRSETEFKADQWREFGPWLVLLILPIVAFGFRRGYLAIFVCVLMISPDDASAFEWRDLWLNKNQKAMQALNNKQTKAASELFQDDAWKAAAKYRAGDYAAAEKLLNNFQDADNTYNKANALAKQGRFEEAIKVYEQVLKNAPDHDDAKFNKALVEKELEKQQQQQSQSNQDSNEDSEQKEQNKSEQQQQNSQSKRAQQQTDSEQQTSESDQQRESQQEQQKSGTEQQQQSQKEQQKSDQEQENAKSKKQQQAKQKEAMKQQAKEDNKKQNEEKPSQRQQAMNELDEERQSEEQWLRRIPDDPSGLLRRKFKYQYQRQKRQASTNEKYW